MEYNKVQFGTLVLIDLTNDTITADDVAQGKKFHLKDGTLTFGNVVAVTEGSVINAYSSNIYVEDGFLKIKMDERLFRKGSILRLSRNKAFGTATASDVRSGKTFSSSAGFCITGTGEF